MTEFGYARNDNQVDQMLKSVGALLRKRVHSIRMMGSGVLDLCWVACGRLDAAYAGVSGRRYFDFFAIIIYFLAG